MKAYVNRHLFTQTTLDSGSLTMGLAVIHKFSETGEYFGTIHHREKKDVGSFQLTIDRECPIMQADIDLSKLYQPSRGESICKRSSNENERRFILNPNGYAIFYVSNGAGRYALTVVEARREVQAKTFDSRKLIEGDMFAATMIRPGIYIVTNAYNKAKADLSVAYPKIGTVPYHPPNPILIECTKDRFEPNFIKIETAQGQLYRIRTPSRIKIELVEPKEGANNSINIDDTK
jgi:hypothetical protein